MAEKKSSGGKPVEKDKVEELREALWNAWRDWCGGSLDRPATDNGRDSSSESDGGGSSGGSSGTPEERGHEANAASGGDGPSDSKSPHSDDSDLQADTSLSADLKAGGSGERWSTMDGSEHTADCPCCVATTSSDSESKEQSKIVALSQDEAIKRALKAQQIRERSERCRAERQMLLRIAIWNSWCAKSRALWEENEKKKEKEKAPKPLRKSKSTDMLSVLDVTENGDYKYSPLVAENSFSTRTSYENNSSSKSLDCASSEFSDLVEENDWLNAHCEFSGVEELSTSFSSCTLPGHVPPNDSRGTSSDDIDIGWSDCEECDESEECFWDMPSFFRSRPYYDDYDY